MTKKNKKILSSEEKKVRILCAYYNLTFFNNTKVTEVEPPSSEEKNIYGNLLCRKGDQIIKKLNYIDL